MNGTVVVVGGVWEEDGGGWSGGAGQHRCDMRVGRRVLEAAFAAVAAVATVGTVACESAVDERHRDEITAPHTLKDEPALHRMSHRGLHCV